MRVTTAEFIADTSVLTDRARIEPVTITKDGRDVLVLVAAEEYARMAVRTRLAVRSEDLPDDLLAAIATAEVPAEYAHLDAEVRDWRP